tara:strand:+ start:25 stop:222 length:198 start_codon:yes stop_codon:yes gene_type:complete
MVSVLVEATPYPEVMNNAIPKNVAIVTNRKMLVIGPAERKKVHAMNPNEKASIIINTPVSRFAIK